MHSHWKSWLFTIIMWSSLVFTDYDTDFTQFSSPSKTTGQTQELPAKYRPSSEKLPANFQKLPAKNAGTPPIYLALAMFPPPSKWYPIFYTTPTFFCRPLWSWGLASDFFCTKKILTVGVEYPPRFDLSKKFSMKGIFRTLGDMSKKAPWNHGVGGE